MGDNNDAEEKGFSFAIPQLVPLTPEQQAAFDRWQKAHDTRLLAEDTRRRQLVASERSIGRALEAYEQIDTGELDSVRIRGELFRCDPPRELRADEHPYSLGEDLSSRPLLTRLVARKQHTLRMLLSLIYVAHLENGPGEPFANHHPNMPRHSNVRSWLELGGLWEPAAGRQWSTHLRAQRRKLTTSLKHLAGHNILVTGEDEAAGRYRQFGLLSETGSTAAYTVPGKRQARTNDVIEIPADFFRHGWHLVLDDLEIATLIAIIDRTGELRYLPRTNGVHDIGVDLKGSIRWPVYGLSGEAYSSVNKLDEFGCIDKIDPMPHRRSSRKPIQALVFGSAADEPTQAPKAHPEVEEEQVNEAREAYRLVYPPETNEHPFARDAISVVRDRLFDDSGGHMRKRVAEGSGP